MKVIIGVVIFVFTVISGLQALERKNAAYYQSLNESLKQSQDSYFKEEEVEVTLSGNIKNPGIYTIQAGDFLESVIEMAGGCLEDTDHEAFNYYLVITAKVNLYIPKISDNKKVSLNSSTKEELKTLPSVGITLANRIIQYRLEVGGFSYLEQIMEVNGIGNNIFQSIKDLIIL